MNHFVVPCNAPFAFFERRCGRQQCLHRVAQKFSFPTFSQVNGLPSSRPAGKRQGWSNLCPSCGFWQLDLLIRAVSAPTSHAAVHSGHLSVAIRHRHRCALGAHSSPARRAAILPRKHRRRPRSVQQSFDGSLMQLHRDATSPHPRKLLTVHTCRRAASPAAVGCESAHLSALTGGARVSRTDKWCFILHDGVARRVVAAGRHDQMSGAGLFFGSRWTSNTCRRKVAD